MKTLQGVRIAVTRAAKQSSELAKPLEAAGAQVLMCPLITVEPRRLDGDLHRMLDRLTDYDWIVLTSVNGVEQFIKLVRTNLPNSVEVLGERRFACVGPATAQALAGYGLPTHAMPDEFVGERVAAA